MLLHPETLPVLRLLSDGAPRSIAALSSASGLAPARIQAACDQLADLGAELLREGGSGAIRLGAPCAMLDAARIAALCGASGPVRAAVHVLDQCESTNEVLRSMAINGSPSGTGLGCEVQTGGRGRRGRKWIAPPGASVALSVLWRFSCGLEALAGLSLAAAVASAQALERCGSRELAIKWPNDLLRDGAKVGGILVDTIKIGAEHAAIIGIGLNLRLGHTAHALIDSLRGAERALPAAALGVESQGMLDRNTIIAALVDELCAACALFEREGLEPFRAAWLERHAFHNAEVTIGSGAGPFVNGRVVDVASDGALVVDTDQGPKHFYAGDVSLRA